MINKSLGCNENKLEKNKIDDISDMHDIRFTQLCKLLRQVSLPRQKVKQISYMILTVPNKKTPELLRGRGVAQNLVVKLLYG